MIFLKAFIVGGIICTLVQIVIDKTKVTPARIMVSLVCIGVDLVESSDIIRERLIARTRSILLTSQIRKAIHPGRKRVPVISTWTIEHYNRRNGRSGRRGADIPER